MSVESTRKVMMSYFSSEHSADVLADDVVYIDVTSGNESRTPVGVSEMLNWFYHVAFDATAETTSLVIGDGCAAWEGVVIGKHIGEFAGIPATGKDFRVPICVFYDLANDKIKRARIHFNVAVLLQQLEV